LIQLQNSKTNFGKLTFNYKSDENSYHCSCACGNKIILTKEQLESKNSCGCEARKLIWAACGKSGDEFEFDSKILPTPQVGYADERGVRFEKGKGKWRVRVTFQGKEYHLGYYSEKDAALEVRREAEVHLNSDFIEWYTKFRQGDLQP
jgi:hypothetical protein